MKQLKLRIAAFCSIGVLVCISSRLIFARDKPWTLDAIMNLKRVGRPQITADGSKVAFVVTSVNSKRNGYDSQIWIVAAAGGTPYPLVSPHFTDSSPRWSGDGKTLAFLSRRDGTSQVYVADPLDRPPRKLTESPTPLTYFKWSQDQQFIGYLALDPPGSEELKQRDVGDDAVVANERSKYSRIYMVPVQGGKARLVTPANRHVISFDWAPDRSKIVYAGQVTPRNRDTFNVDLYEIDTRTGREKALVAQEGRDADPCYSRDGTLVAFHSQAGTLNYFEERRVGIVPSGGGPIRYLIEKMEGDVFRGGDEFWWSQDNSELVFGAGVGTRDVLLSTILKGGTSSRTLAPLHGASSFSVSRDGSRLAFIKSSSNWPPELYLLERGGMGVRETRLSDLNPQVKELASITARTIRWKSGDGLEVEGVLRLPIGYKPGDRVPLLVELHGGPTGVALEEFPIPSTYPSQLFAQESFAVLSPNFRGSSNYGGKFRLANIKSQGFGDFDDVMTGIDVLVQKGLADPDRLGVMGWSYGGFLTTWIIGHTNRFKAASIGATGSDWISWYGASDGPREVLWTYFGAKPWDGWETYNHHSPRYSLINAKTPSLLLHGERDIDSTPEVFQALTDLGVPCEFVTYPREGHGIEEPMHQRDLMERNLRWFKKWILGK